MSKELAKKETGYELAALGDNGLGLTAEEIEEELGGETPRYPRIKIPAGGVTSFEIQQEGDETEMKKTLEGVVVWHHSANAYWISNDTQNTQPDCASLDGKWGTGNPGGPCPACPLNEFGSGEGGKGKACKNMKRLYLLTKDSLFPYALSLPPTSLGKFTDYVSMTLAKGKKVCDIVTTVSLTKKENSAGIAYSQAVFKSVGALDSETMQRSREYRETIKAFVAAGTDVAQEFVEAEAMEIDETTGEVIPK